jgi:type II secretion system protein G
MRLGYRCAAARPFRMPAPVLILVPILLMPPAAGWWLDRHSCHYDVRFECARSDLAAIDLALDQFHTDTGYYPSNDEGLAPLVSAPSNYSNWKGPYLLHLSHRSKDPWGHPYVYRRLPAGGYEIRSAGPDGKLHTSDDITSGDGTPE